MGIITPNTDEYFMQLAIKQAKIAEKLGEVPVGAVLIQDNKIITKACNQQIIKNDPSAHAEIELLRLAGKKLKNYRLLKTTLFVTLEPCLMCFGAIIHARIKRLVFATKDPKTGVCGSWVDLLKNDSFNHKLEITSGVLANEGKKLLQDFFKNKRIKK